jgi:hypothetical protein
VVVLLLINLVAVACTQGLTETPTVSQTPFTVQPTPVAAEERTVEPMPSETGSAATPTIPASHGNVYIDSYEIERGNARNSVVLVLRGNLPTPCHKLRVNVQEPDAQSRIYVEVYSTVSSSLVCTQVMQPFTNRVQINSLADGNYMLYLNLKQIAEFSIPFNGQVTG